MNPRLDILLVDDDPNDLRLFVLAVEKSNFNIGLQALNAGQQAIDYFEAKGVYRDRSLHPLPDLVVLDLKMPQISGFDFLAWRKPSAVFSSIPVVVLSASREPTEARRALDMGANRHLVKPEDFEGWKLVVRDVWKFGTEGTAFLRAKRTAENPAP